ncbi:ComEC/Rec2 family competence protein [Pseudochelatococcus sp. G4_1912]|uniref:ComEC/Rec2 family competence protein n=1 Tax=Pseudochelatococcus sp. G4_1912 TaxID=3114288 RepID=UPI0039C73893
MERRRLFLWLPVAYGLGVAFYFSADREPSIWAAPIAAIAMISMAVALRNHWRYQLFTLFIGMVFLGFFVASFRTEMVREPVLDHTMIVPLQGFVRSVDERLQGPRAVIDVIKMGDLQPDKQPAHVRVSFRRGSEVVPGTIISTVARMVPPPEPARPGGYDFARDAFFNGIGAVGSVNGKVELAADNPYTANYGSRLIAWIDFHRNALTRRILQSAGGPEMPATSGGDRRKAIAQVRAQEAAFVAALVTGKRGMLSDETNEALRAAGIYHVVSIGGFHMTLVAGTIFFLTRALLALVPGLALLYPIRKMAAVTGIIGASLYCIFSGAGIDTQRALFVTIIVMGAILVDRPALSMRNLALSALVCLTFQPETLLGPSFQMSFAGVAALIALFERWENNDSVGAIMPLREGGKLNLSLDGYPGSKLYRMILASLATTIVAMLATGPFSTYHFQTLNPWGLVGNAFGLPLVELLVMPLSFAAVLLHPLGLDGPFWYLAGLASVPVLEGSRIVANFEGSSVVVPAFGAGVLALMVLALLWGCLWSTPLRWLAVLPAGLGIALAAAPDRPDIRIDREGRGAAVRAVNGRFVILGRPSGFVVEQWLRADGDARRVKDPSLKENVACDKLGCVTTLHDGRSIAFALDQRAAEEDCKRATIFITRWRTPKNCAAKYIIDRNDLERYGSIAGTFKGDSLFLKGLRDINVIAQAFNKNDQSSFAEEIGRPWRRNSSQ